jgi:hypothetical protein
MPVPLDGRLAPDALPERRPRSVLLQAGRLAYTRGIGGSLDCESRHDGHTAWVKR